MLKFGNLDESTPFRAQRPPGQLPTVRFGPVGDSDDLAVGVKRCCFR
ncbi:hypothetical protein ACIP6X_04900 [Streptomyces coeruleorubidus]|jgi:hypothetical protein